MRIENDELFFRVIFTEKERESGLINNMEEKLPRFGRFFSDDKLEWYIENRHRDLFTRLINQHLNSPQLSLF